VGFARRARLPRRARVRRHARLSGPRPHRARGAAPRPARPVRWPRAPDQPGRRTRHCGRRRPGAVGEPRRDRRRRAAGGRPAPPGARALGDGRVRRHHAARGSPTCRRRGRPRRGRGGRADGRRDRRNGRRHAVDRMEPRGVAAGADLRPAERRSPGTAAHALGAALTLVGGALALLPPLGPLAWRGAAAGPALLLALTLAAICWGTYAVYVAPELALAAPPAAGVVELPAFALSAPGGRALVATSVLAMLLLFVATALALRDVIAMHARPANADVAWAGLLMLAAVAGLWPADPWRAWLAGCGLAAAAVAIPRLAGRDARAGLAGSLAGAAVFAALAAVGGRLPAWAAAGAAYPA